MPVKLRLRRQGRKNAAHYGIVVADSRSPRDGRFIEKIGHYNPLSQPARVYVDHDAALRWLKNGAQPTNTVRSLLSHAGVILKFALMTQGKSPEETDRIFGKWREQKDNKPKKKVISVDVNNQPLEPIPGSKTKVVKPAAAPAPAPEVHAPVAEAPAPVAEAPAPADEAPAADPGTPDTPAVSGEHTEA
ncbi:MAG: 30S ribosomal protein S16 [Bacteroidia bacterium]|nr:30S ribosomal protein S16 [Bacteroidia bacterium]